MRRRLFLFALALILLSNAVVLAKVSFNRAAVLERLLFTEREMHSRYSSIRENSGLILTLRWTTPMKLHTNYYGSNNSLEVSNDVRESLGFSELDCENNSYRYNDDETTAWALMELAGQAYENDIVLLESRLQEARQTNKDKQEVKRLEDQVGRLREYNSRLYAVAVAADPSALLRVITDSDKQFVMKAVVADSKYCKKEVYLKQLSINNLYVPKSILKNETRLPKNYHVHIAIGNLGEAWVEKIVSRSEK